MSGISRDDVLGVTRSVTKKWRKQRKAEESGRSTRYSREYIYSDRVNCTEVADDILPKTLKRQLRAAMKDQDDGKDEPWDRVLYRMVNEKVKNGSF